jgi:hypothetical protein
VCPGVGTTSTPGENLGFAVELLVAQTGSVDQLRQRVVLTSSWLQLDAGTPCGAIVGVDVGVGSHPAVHEDQPAGTFHEVAEACLHPGGTGPAKDPRR